MSCIKLKACSSSCSQTVCVHAQDAWSRFYKKRNSAKIVRLPSVKFHPSNNNYLLLKICQSSHWHQGTSKCKDLRCSLWRWEYWLLSRLLSCWLIHVSDSYQVLHDCDTDTVNFWLSINFHLSIALPGFSLFCNIIIYSYNIIEIMKHHRAVPLSFNSITLLYLLHYSI